MVEQIDRDAAADLLGGAAPDGLVAGFRDSLSLVQTLAAHRAAERARMIAAMRQPDAAMVEAVRNIITGWEDKIYWACERGTQYDRNAFATAALSAAADHMETRDAG